MEFTRLPNESKLEFIYRVCDHKTEIGTWDDVRDVLNEALGEHRSEASYRKKYQAMKKIAAGEVPKKDASANIEETSYSDIVELQKERIKIRDERNELNKLIREQARRESFKEQIIREVCEHHTTPLSYDSNKKFSGVIKSDNDLLISLFDIHAGIDTKNYWNIYNTDVLKQRLNKYLDKIFEVQLRHGSEKAYVVISEAVSGLIHPTLRIENNKDLIDQFLIVTDYICEMLMEMSYRFEHVNVYVAIGNHGRLSPKKEDNLVHENIDFLLLPFIRAKLQNFGNVHCFDNEMEQTIAVFRVRDWVVYSSHGDRESFSNAASKLTMFTSMKPDIYLCGHRHSNAMSTDGTVKLLQAGSVSGPDEYCMDKRLNGLPEQLITVITEKDCIDCIYDVTL